MRRLVLLITLATIVIVVMLTLGGTASAQSCFGLYSKDRIEKGGNGPGETVSRAATTLGHTAPGSESEFVQEMQRLRQQICPTG